MLNQEQQIFEQIKKAQNILITFTKTWNGDSAASALAFFLLLKKMGKNADIAAEKPDSESAVVKNPLKIFSFLPSFSEIKPSIENLRKFIISLDISNAKVSQIKYKMEDNALNFIISPKDGFFTADDISSSSSGFKYDLIICLDTPDLESLGKIYDNDTEFFYKTTVINIDHHSDNEEYGQINAVDLNAVATSEILFSLFQNYSRDLIDDDIATCLLTGIIAKTKSFKTSNITPSTLSITSQLISMGARRDDIISKLFRSRELNVLKLWGRVLARLNSSLDNKLVWSSLSFTDFLKTESNEEDLADVIEELIINIPQARVIVLLYEKAGMKENMKNPEDLQGAMKCETNILVYSVKNISALDLIKEYNPRGSKRLAQATIDKAAAFAENDVTELIKGKMEKLTL
jgi:nanoRNase/pAp phosphatase (c-di-AMP/oligoRNAs hydrolase)